VIQYVLHQGREANELGRVLWVGLMVTGGLVIGGVVIGGLVDSRLVDRI